MMSDLSKYKVTFKQMPITGGWTYKVVTPKGDTLQSVWALGFLSREAAERDALSAIERHASIDVVDGEVLRERVGACDSTKTVASSDHLAEKPHGNR